MSGLLYLQRTAGNTAIATLLAPVIQRMVRPWIQEQVKGIERNLKADPQGAFNDLNVLSLEDLLETLWAMSPNTWAAVKEKWALTKSLDVPRFNMARNIVDAGAAGRALAADTMPA